MAYALTGSVGLLSDAVESVIHVVAAGVALWALTLAARPPDEEHAYGHSKAEYFSSGVEGMLILGAAAGIAWYAFQRLLEPRPLEYLGLGSLLALGASSVNLAVAMNARGGPGIVVASTAYAAGIIDQPFYAVLVLLAIITSLAAGAWLDRVPREQLLARGEEAPRAAPEAAVA